MKSINLILVLFFIALSCANSIINPSIFKRDNPLTEKCMNENENSEYSNECLPVITLSNYKEACSNVKTEKCETFYKDPLKYYPICSKETAFAEILQPAIVKDLV